tara:strand:- start:23642 stop:25330 length:1689 start_codon:yes stop_codon:yes gene_type:complete
LERFIITAALPYANGPIHIGHIAGAYLPADIFVRYQKLKQNDVIFVCGSDEHGAAITLRAKKEQKTPREIIDLYHEKNEKSFKALNINFNIYHRTSSKLHHETAQSFFKNLHSKNVFVKKKSKQFFDISANQFLADRYIKGTCPKCGFKEAYGDQCESCGTTLSPLELIDPKSTISGNSPELKETSHWYLPLNKNESWLNEWIVNGYFQGNKVHDPKTWKNNVLGQCKSWIDGGLQSRAMTRDLDWGVPVPLDGEKGKVLYVWLDAPIGYISATKEWAKKEKVDWEKYWKNPETKLINFIGKDNIVFHCIIFPILLKEHGNFILPKNVPANEFLNLEGRKISTSRNHAIWIDDYLNNFANKTDELRFVLCSISPENKDSDFTWKDFQARNNNELVAIFGNFVNRVIVLINKYWDGSVPARGEIHEEDENLINKIIQYPKKIGKSIEKYKFREALFEVINLARLGNKYLADNEPWKQIKINPKRAETILNISIQMVFSLSVLSKPFLPKTSKKLCKILNSDFSNWDCSSEINNIKEDHKIGPPEHLFEIIDNEKINDEISKLN